MENNIIFGKQYYKGDFVKGKMEGKGKIKFEYTNADGSYNEYVHYEGNFENCFWHGKGKRYYKDGSIMYDGEWKNGRRNGLGIFYYENGECYDGEFKNDLPDGKGNWYMAKGIGIILDILMKNISNILVILKKENILVIKNMMKIIIV